MERRKIRGDNMLECSFLNQSSISGDSSATKYITNKLKYCTYKYEKKCYAKFKVLYMFNLYIQYIYITC